MVNMMDLQNRNSFLQIWEIDYFLSKTNMKMVNRMDLYLQFTPILKMVNSMVWSCILDEFHHNINPWIIFQNLILSSLCLILSDNISSSVWSCSLDGYHHNLNCRIRFWNLILSSLCLMLSYNKSSIVWSCLLDGFNHNLNVRLDFRILSYLHSTKYYQIT